MKCFSVAIDGPSGAGKSTLARKAAAVLGYLYVDTGAIYRTVALSAVRRGIDPADGERLVPVLGELDTVSGMTMLGVGLACVGISQLKKKD